MGAAGAGDGAGHVWLEKTGVLDIESGLGTDWETGSGDGTGAGGVVEGQDAGIQGGTEVQAWTVVWEELAGCAVIAGG